MERKVKRGKRSIQNNLSELQLNYLTLLPQEIQESHQQEGTDTRTAFSTENTAKKNKILN